MLDARRVQPHPGAGVLPDTTTEIWSAVTRHCFQSADLSARSKVVCRVRASVFDEASNTAREARALPKSS